MSRNRKTEDHSDSIITVWIVCIVIALVLGAGIILRSDNASSSLMNLLKNGTDASGALTDQPASTVEASAGQSTEPDLYQADESGFYYRQLPDAEKKIYLIVKQGFELFSSSAKATGASSSEASEAARAFQLDHPELSWMGEISPGSDDVSIIYKEDASARSEQLNAKAEEISSGIPASATEYDAVKVIYDSLKQVNSGNEKGADHALLDGQAGSEGIADAFKILCDHENISCITVSDQESAWNLVSIGSKWYWVDCTKANEFLVSDEVINADHSIPQKLTEDGTTVISYPSCSENYDAS